jgi:hypothetical protein
MKASRPSFDMTGISGLDQHEPRAALWTVRASAQSSRTRFRLCLPFRLHSAGNWTTANPRLLDQTADNRIAVHVTELLDPFVFIVHEKVVVASLPERPLFAPHRHRELECVDDAGNHAFDRLTDHKVNVLRHDNITGYYEAVTFAHAVQRILEKITRIRSAQILAPVKTTKC